jgi:hypothetical protein
MVGSLSIVVGNSDGVAGLRQHAARPSLIRLLASRRQSRALPYTGHVPASDGSQPLLLLDKGGFRTRPDLDFGLPEWGGFGLWAENLATTTARP